MTRTRGNGEELTAAGLAEDILAFGQRVGMDTEARELAKDLYEVVLIAEQRSQSRAFSEGMNLGAKVENRVAVQSVVTALLRVIGQDPGDGLTDLGKVGSWFAASDDGFAVRKEV